jgi:hypothetical protein
VILIHRGLGYLVFVILFVVSLAANVIVNAAYGDRYYDNHKWPLFLSLILSAIIIWFVGRHLRKRSDRVVIDKQTGEEMIVNMSTHDLFFIRMEYWSPIILVIGLSYLIYRAIHSNSTGLEAALWAAVQ